MVAEGGSSAVAELVDGMGDAVVGLVDAVVVGLVDVLETLPRLLAVATDGGKATAAADAEEWGHTLDKGSHAGGMEAGCLYAISIMEIVVFIRMVLWVLFE